MEEDKSYKREFSRFTMGMEMEVSATDQQGNPYAEKAILKEISGDGARFSSRQVHKYYPGQILDLIVYLPGTQEVKANIGGKATVVRIEPLACTDGAEDACGDVAVTIDIPLHFERAGT